jgi:D-3-phosphoglycerate dehydrogenase
MGKKKWTILIIGDRFVTSGLFKEAIEHRTASLDVELNLRIVETSWPDDPLKDVEDVHEAVGDVDQMIEQLSDVNIIVTDYGAVTTRMIEAAPHLKLIACSRGGPVSISIRAASERGIPVVNLPGRNSAAVAEFTLGLMFSQMKRIAECHTDMKRGIWRGDCYRFENAPRELSGQVVGLVGFGDVGQSVARLLRCFGTKVIVHDPFIKSEIVREFQVQSIDLETLLAQSDVVSLHARATAENTAMIGEAQLKIMKPTAHLINTARGTLVDHQALYRALKEKWIAGAALDIYDVEPVQLGHYLLELNNVTFSPHIAGSSRETAIRSADLLAQEVVRFMSNKPVVHPVK